MGLHTVLLNVNWKRSMKKYSLMQLKFCTYLLCALWQAHCAQSGFMQGEAASLHFHCSESHDAVPAKMWDNYKQMGVCVCGVGGKGGEVEGSL